MPVWLIRKKLNTEDKINTYLRSPMYSLHHVIFQGGRLQQKMLHAKISMKYKTVTFKRDKTFSQPQGQNK